MDPTPEKDRSSNDKEPTGPVRPEHFEVMFPLGDGCFVPASIVSDTAVGARYRATRILAGLTFQEVAERGNEAPSLAAANNHRDEGDRYHLTAEWV